MTQALPKDVAARVKVQKDEPILSAVAHVELKRDHSHKTQRLRKANSAGEAMTSTVRNQLKLIDELKMQIHDHESRAETHAEEKAEFDRVAEENANRVGALRTENAQLIQARTRLSGRVRTLSSDLALAEDKRRDTVFEASVMFLCVGLLVGALATVSILQFA